MRDPMCASDVYLQATFTPQCICKGHVDGYAPACHRNVVTLCLGLSFDAIRSPHMAVGVRSNNKIGEHAVVNKNVVAHSHILGRRPSLACVPDAGRNGDYANLLC